MIIAYQKQIEGHYFRIVTRRGKNNFTLTVIQLINFFTSFMLFLVVIEEIQQIYCGTDNPMNYHVFRLRLHEGKY